MTSEEPTTPKPSRPDGDQVTSGETVVRELEGMQVEEPSDKPVWIPARVTEWVAALVVIALAVAITAGVIVRFLGDGIFGVVELSALSMVVVVLLGASALAARDGHVKLELLDTVLRPRQLTVIKIFGDVVQILVSAVLAYAMFDLFMNDLDRGTTVAGDVQFPRVALSGVAMVCFVILTATIALRLVRDLRRRDAPADREDDA